jgi:mono/diheme cytochrome c family protein
MPPSFERVTPSAVLAIMTVLALGFVDSFVGAAEQGAAAPTTRTVWDGVYNSAQAARGRSEYDASCASCHNGGEGPSLVGETFMRAWFEDSLNDVLTKMRTAMPENAPGSLAETAYRDILAFILESNGFPAGAQELPPSDELARVLVVGKEGPGGPVPNFSLVRVVGCLTQSDKDWVLTRGTEPARAKDPGASSPSDLSAAGEKPLGTHVFKLLDIPPKIDTMKGGKIQAKGFLIRQPNEMRLNLTSVETLGQSCPG